MIRRTISSVTAFLYSPMVRRRVIFNMSSGKDPKGFKGFKRQHTNQNKKPTKEAQQIPSKEAKQDPKEKDKEHKPVIQEQQTTQQQKKSAQQQSTTNSKQSNESNKQDPNPNKQNDPNINNNKWKAWQEWLQNNYKPYEQKLQQYWTNYRFRYYHLIWLALLIYYYPRKQRYSYSEFLKQLEEHSVDKVVITSSHNNKIKLTTVLYSVNGERAQVIIESSEDLLRKLSEYPNVEVKFSNHKPFYQVINDSSGTLNFIGCLAVLLIIGRLFRQEMKNSKGGGGMFDLNKKKFQMVKDIKIKFKDVAGLKESKLEIEQFVDFLKYPQKYKDVGARIPKGALLTGPPGTGKTLLAKACAGEAGVPFFFASGSDFVEMYVGVGAARIRQLFKEAKAMSPSIIFIDEIDAVGRKRQDNLGSNDQRDGTLNQLLVQMDGFGTDTKVIVMAATNRKELLDNALIRPGRFDRNIEINLPDLQGRWEIFMVHLSPLKLNINKTKQEYAKRLATLTPGFSGAEIANICNEAAILAARNGKQAVDTIDFEMATERVLGGVERKSLASPEERKVVAVHESGHGVVSWFLEGAYPLLKLTIIPRSKGALGFAQYLPKESLLESKEQLIDRICFILGGRCAQEHFFKRITTGAYDDLQKAYQVAETLVTKYGMNTKMKYMSFQESDYLKNYSEETGDLIDQEIKIIIDRCTKITKEMVAKHEDQIRRLSDALLEKESLDGKEILKILGDRPFEHHSSYKAYLQMQKKDEEEKQIKQLPSPASQVKQ